MIDIGVCKELGDITHKYDEFGFMIQFYFNKYGMVIYVFWNDPRKPVSGKTYKYNKIYEYSLLEELLKNNSLEHIVDELIKKEFTAELNKKGEDLVWWN